MHSERYTYNCESLAGPEHALANIMLKCCLANFLQSSSLFSFLFCQVCMAALWLPSQIYDQLIAPFTITSPRQALLYSHVLVTIHAASAAYHTCCMCCHSFCIQLKIWCTCCMAACWPAWLSMLFNLQQAYSIVPSKDLINQSLHIRLMCMLASCACSTHVHAQLMCMLDSCPYSPHVHAQLMCMLDSCPYSPHVHAQLLCMLDSCACSTCCALKHTCMLVATMLCNVNMPIHADIRNCIQHSHPTPPTRSLIVGSEGEYLFSILSGCQRNNACW